MNTPSKTGNNQASKKGKNGPTKGGGKNKSGSSRNKHPRLVMDNSPLRSVRTGRWT